MKSILKWLFRLTPSRRRRLTPSKLTYDKHGMTYSQTYNQSGSQAESVALEKRQPFWVLTYCRDPPSSNLLFRPWTLVASIRVFDPIAAMESARSIRARNLGNDVLVEIAGGLVEPHAAPHDIPLHEMN